MRKAATVADLCDFYLAEAEAGRVLTRSKTAKKASTLSVHKGRIERHIKPLLGGLAIASVTRDDVERFLYDVAEGRTAGKTKTAKNVGWRASPAAERRQHARLDSSVPSSPMPCGVACAPTTPRMASNGLPIGSVLGASPMTNTRHSAMPCAKPMRPDLAAGRSRRRGSSP